MRDSRLYMLRIWIEEEDTQAPWRALLEDARTGHRWGFTRLEELIAFLARETGASLAPQFDSLRIEELRSVASDAIHSK